MALILVLFLLLPSTAHAGTYDVHACRLPDGSPAPTRSWAAFETYAGTGAHGSTADDCAAGGALSGVLAISTALASSGTGAGWRFDAPPGTTIAGFVVRRYARSSYSPLGAGAAGYFAAVDDAVPDSSSLADFDHCFAAPPSGGSPCAELGSPTDPEASDDRYSGERTARSLSLSVGCLSWTGPAECAGTEDEVLRILAARVTLDDSAPPTFASAPAVGPVVAFAGSDQGGGLTDGAIMVDGVERGRAPVPGRGAACQAPYVDPVPCPSTADVRIALDPRSLALGAHTLQAVLYDVAGNRSLSAPVRFSVDANAILGPIVSRVPGPNGSNATRFVRLRSWFAGRSKRTVKTLAYGQKGSIVGVLTTAAGVPIAGATLTVEEHELGSASRARPTATVTTDRKGGFAYRTGVGPSRTVRVSYRAFPEDPSPVVVSETTLHVRAGVSLRVTPARVRNGSVITFRGVVRGKRRAIVTIYALAGGPRKRIPVETVRAGSDGRFVYRYRFRSIPEPTTYRFVAVVPKQTGFPYSAGESGSVAVRGRP